MSSCGCAKHTLASHPASPGAPVACTIERGDLAKRAQDFRDAFRFLVDSRRTHAGFRWIFRDEPGFEPVLRDLAAQEHTCCEFLIFVISREDGHLVWQVEGTPEAAAAIDIFYALPQTIHQDVETLIRNAAAAGLPFTDDDGHLEPPRR